MALRSPVPLPPSPIPPRMIRSLGATVPPLPSADAGIRHGIATALAAAEVRWRNSRGSTPTFTASFLKGTGHLTFSCQVACYFSSPIRRWCQVASHVTRSLQSVSCGRSRRYLERGEFITSAARRPPACLRPPIFPDREQSRSFSLQAAARSRTLLPRRHPVHRIRTVRSSNSRGAKEKTMPGTGTNSAQHAKGPSPARGSVEACGAVVSLVGSVATEMYVWYGTNECSFETLPNPRSTSRRSAAGCGKVVVLGSGRSDVGGDCGAAPAGSGVRRRRLAKRNHG